MIETPPSEGRSGPLNPQLALRVAVVGTVALAMFAVIFFRLWFIQVLSGDHYVALASDNSTRLIPVPSERGEILDRNGTVLVSSTEVPTVEISGPSLPTPITIAEMSVAGDRPPADDVRIYNRLARVLSMSTKPQACKVVGAATPPAGTRATLRLSPIACLVAQGVANTAYNNVTIEQDVPKDVWLYIGERQTSFPGVITQEQYVRHYPDGDLAAQVLGTVGQINSSEVNTSPFKGIQGGNLVGQSGLEYQYNSLLQGADGTEKVRVNAANQFEGYEGEKPPTTGENLQTSIDAQLQKAGQQALQTSIAENVGGNDGGAFVAMDPQNGQVYAMGSAPTYNPSVFTHPISTKEYDQDFGAGSNDPLLNRAVQTTGPTGSTFKVITATAALESGDWLVDQTYDDTGHFCIDGECRQNSGGAVYGEVDLEKAIQVSDDNFFYNLGALTNSDNPQGGPLQKWAHLYGIGRKTGIDLPDEAEGNLPTPAERAHDNVLEQECDDATGPFRYSNGKQVASRIPKGKAGKGWHRSPTHPPGGCGLAVYPFETWTIGDNVNTAVGQGDDQVTPLQLAVVYAALENGGTIVTPHVGEDIQSPDGTVIQKINPAPKRHLNINPFYLDTIRQGLRLAAGSPGGTSYDVMGKFPLPVYGKTGTAQYFNAENVETDYAWYACYVPASATSKPIVIVVTVAKGGFGDVAAAPVAHQMLSQWFLGHVGSYTSGTSDTL